MGWCSSRDRVVSFSSRGVGWVMNILIIPTNDWIRAPGHGHIDFIAEELAERGHRVYAWHFDLCRNEKTKRKPRNVRLLKPRTLWVRDPAFFYLLNAFVHLSAMFKAIRDLKIDVIINENILPGLFAFLVSPPRVLKVFDFSDYFPESASVHYDDSQSVFKRLVEGTALCFTKLNIKFADVCLAVCRSLIEVVRSIDDTKACYLLTNGVDMNKLAVQESRERRSEVADSMDNTMVIMGVIDSWLDLMTPLKALEILRHKIPNVKILLIGPWRKRKHREDIQSFVETHDLQAYVNITGYVSDQRLARYLREGTCCLMPYKTDSFSSIIRLPEKLFVYSAYGKPILSTPLPEVAALRSEHVFFYHNVDELVGMASALMIDADQSIDRADLSAKAYDFAQKHDVRVLAGNLEQILLNSL